MSRLLTVFLFISLVYSDKLNERRILLPYNSGVPTNFTLETYGGTSCFKWSSSRPDIASVKYIENSSCSKRAIVTVVSTIPKRQSTVITALDLKTNLQIRCDVEIDVIKRIAIQTTTKEIIFGELPETIKVSAYSDKNDIFTSIGGISFDWSLNPSDIIRYRPWSSSPYAAPDFVEYWESRGAKSSNILVQGVKTGSANIRASILGDAYRSVKEVEINIHVVANLLLIPSNDIFLVPGAKVHFRAEISKQGPRTPLNFPNQQYYMEVNDPNIAVFDEQTNLLEALKEGSTTLVLKDRNMIISPNSANDSDLFFSRTRTDIHVMQPGYISMSIQPGDSFHLCNDYIYNLQLTLYDDLQHRLYLSDNLDFELQFNGDFIEVIESSKNKTFYVIRARKIGSTKLIARFNGAGTYILTDSLIHQQDVTIYPSISLNPEEIYLPWIHSMDITYESLVNAIGATGAGYNWQSSNESVAMVKYNSQKSSQATISIKGLLGEAIITCTDVHNSLIFNAVMKIRILPIDEVEILHSIVEAPVGGNVLLPIAVLAFKDKNLGHKFYFDDCSKVKFNVNIVEKTRIRYNEDSFTPGIGKYSCRSLSFECVAPGNSHVIINYQAGNDRKISTHANIGCFKPLKLIHPKDFAILSLGAGIDLAFEGGPRPWSMYPEGHYTKASPTNTSVVEMKEIRDRYRYNKDLHVFRAYCIDYGETKIDLQVGNVASPTLPNPALTSATVRVLCSHPETLIIKPRTKSTCPQQDAQFMLEKNRNIELEVQVLDQQGIVFYNFSTFYFEWWKDTSMGMFEEINSVREEVNGAHGYTMLVRSYQVLSGLATVKSRVRCRITAYHEHRRFTDKFDVRREIELILTDALVTSENSITVLKHSDYKKTITIDKGSGYFLIDLSEKQMIDVEITKNDKRKFIVTPLLIGNGVISINDLCLDYPSFKLPYSVVEPIDIEVQLVDKIQLGDKKDGTFFILDNRGNKLHSSLHSLLDLTISNSNNFLSIGEIKTKDDYHSSFTIKAERLGLCRLQILSQSTQIRSIQSSQIDVQIFSPLKIVPTNITLIVGNYFQPNFLGGPQTQRNLKFSIENGTVAFIDIKSNPNGMILAHKIGRTRFIASVTSIDNYEYSRAEAELYVLPLNKVKIWLPINQVLLGATIPMYLIGQSEQHETPFMFGHAEPSLKITWSLSNNEIGSLENSFQKFDITDEINDQISARFVAKSSGYVIVKVLVEVTNPAKDHFVEQIYQNQILTAAIEIQVYPNYVLLASSPTDPTHHYWKQYPGQVLLMSPQSELLLHPNQFDSITYHVWNSSSQVKLINQTGNLVLQAGDQLESSFLIIHRDLQRTGVNQYFSQAIHVDKVRYLSLELDSVKYASHLSAINLTTFPIGSEILMIVQYYDQLGRRFDSVKSNIKWAMSRNDIITILGSNALPQSLRIRSLKQGSVILMIWDEVNQVKQYYKIIVGSVIESIPQSDPLVLQIGDIICLNTKLDENYQNKGLWFLDQNIGPVGWIHPQNGMFLALNPGKALVVYNHSTSISTYKHIQVQPINQILLNTDSIVGLSTNYPQSIPIMLNPISKYSTSCASTLNHEDLDQLIYLPFICDVSFDDGISETLWNVELQYNHHHWSCLLLPKSDLNLNSIALWNRNVTLTVMVTTLSDSLSNSLKLIHKVQVPFLPAFQASLKQIILTWDYKEIRFTVYSVRMVLEELVIKSSNDDILNVQKLFEHNDSDLINLNSMKVLVTLKNPDIFSNDVSNLYLILSSKLINQTTQIPVQIKLYGSILEKLPRKIFCPTNSDTTENVFSDIFFLVITIVLAYSIYLIIKHKVVLYRQQQIDSSMFSLRSSSPRTPRIVDYNMDGNSGSPAASPQYERNTAFRTASNTSISSTSSASGSGFQLSDGLSAQKRSPLKRSLYSTRSFYT